jgi:PAS domain S-box-containing protein
MPLGGAWVLVLPCDEHPALSALQAVLEASLSERAWLGALDEAREGVLICDEAGRLLYLNQLGAERAGLMLGGEALGAELERALGAAMRYGPHARTLRLAGGLWWEVEFARLSGLWSMTIRPVDPVRQRERVMSFIARVADQVVRTQRLQDAFMAAAMILREAGGWHWAEIWLSESTRGPLRLHQIDAAPDPRLEALRACSMGLTFAQGQDMPWRAVREGRIEVLTLPDADFVREAEARAAGLTHGLFIPIAERGRVFGVLGFLHETPLVDPSWLAWLDAMQTELTTRMVQHIEWIESQQLFDLSHDVIMVLGLDGTIRRVNAALARVLGWGQDVLDHDSFLSLAHPDDVGLLHALLAQLREQGAAEQVSVRMRHGQGGYRWISWTTRALVDDGFIYAVGRDTTEQQRAAASLVASEQRFRLLARATSDAVWDWDLATDTLWWGDGYTTLFGYPHPGPGATLDGSWGCYIHPEDRAQTVRSLRDAVDSGASDWRAEYRFICADGREAWVMDRGYVIRDARGEPLRVVGGMTDLTERKRAELARAWQAELLDQTLDAILVERLDGVVRYWNRSAAALFGLGQAQVVGQKLRELLALDHDALDAIRAQVMVRGFWAGEVVLPRAGGRELVLDTRWRLLRDEAGQPEELLVVATDVSERKQIELQYLRAQRLESVGTLAGGIAHDLNNILTPIMMSASLLRMELQDAEQLELVSDIASAAQRGAEIIQQILSFARGAEGRRAPLDPGMLLRDVARIGRESFMRTIEILAEVPDALPAVLGDATQLHQVLLNLMINARDAMPDGGTLTLSAEPVHLDARYVEGHPDARCGDYIVISVSDTGTGIEANIRDRIFEPFFTTKPIGQGSGLGLTTVMAIIKGHEGFIHLYTEVDRGTTFKIYLPAVASDAPLRENTPKPLPRGSGELILLVDDEPAILGTTRQMLEAFGYRVLVAADGAEALGTYAANKDRIAIVLTDVMMPFMDGIAMARAMLRMNPQARIIAASGLNAHGTTARLLDVGVRHFLPKPFTADTLLTVLREVIEAG